MSVSVAISRSTRSKLTSAIQTIRHRKGVLELLVVWHEATPRPIHGLRGVEVKVRRTEALRVVRRTEAIDGIEAARLAHALRSVKCLNGVEGVWGIEALRRSEHAGRPLVHVHVHVGVKVTILNILATWSVDHVEWSSAESVHVFWLGRKPR